MHGTKVNTKSSLREKNVPLPLGFVGRIETPYGVQYINRGDALDHAYMVSGQLNSLLMLMQIEGGHGYRSLGQGTQDDLMWLVQQLAEVSRVMFDIVVDDERGAVK